LKSGRYPRAYPHIFLLRAQAMALGGSLLSPSYKRSSARGAWMRGQSVSSCEFCGSCGSSCNVNSVDVGIREPLMDKKKALEH